MTALARWLSRDKSDTLPHTLKRERIYIIPTKQGFVFIAALAVMLMIAVNYNNNLAFLMTFLLFSVLVTSTVHAHRNLSGLKIVSLDAKPVFAGSEAQFRCALDGTGVRRASITLGVDSNPRQSLSVSGKRTERVALSAKTIERGLYRPEAVTISTTYPFAFFVAWSYVYPEASCVVYPRPSKSTMLAQSAAGDSESSKRAVNLIGSQDFQGLRSYQPGDSPKQIYWKGFTKTGQLHTKVYQAAQSTSLLFDFDSLAGCEVEERLSILCNAVMKAAQSNLTYALQLPTKSIPAGRGEKHRRRCLEALALFGVRDSI